MPYALLVFGAVLFVAGIRGKNADLWTLVQGDFTGPGNFIFWLAAIAIVGGAGYAKPIRPISIAFMTLLLVVLMLSNKGVIPKLQSYLQSANAASTSSPSTGSGSSIAPIPALPPLNYGDIINQNLQSVTK